MKSRSRLRLIAAQKSKPLMNARKYRAFIDKFQREVKPDLDKQREARLRSEDEAKQHFVM